MKLRHFLPLASLLCLAACTRRPALPQLGTLCIDTLLSRNGTSCQVDYRFATIRNASDSPALETIEQANIGYFFQLEAFSGTAEKGAEAAIRGRPDVPRRFDPVVPSAPETAGYSTDPER